MITRLYNAPGWDASPSASTMHRLTPMGNLGQPIYVFGQWEKTGEPEGNPQTHQELENLHTDNNPAMLPTAQSHHPLSIMRYFI